MYVFFGMKEVICFLSEKGISHHGLPLYSSQTPTASLNYFTYLSRESRQKPGQCGSFVFCAASIFKEFLCKGLASSQSNVECVNGDQTQYQTSRNIIIEETSNIGKFNPLNSGYSSHHHRMLMRIKMVRICLLGFR